MNVWCVKRLALASNLKSHMLIHTRENPQEHREEIEKNQYKLKPQTCIECGSQFTFANNLKAYRCRGCVGRLTVKHHS